MSPAIQERALLPTPADLEGYCVVCGRVTGFMVALLPRGSFIACRRGAGAIAGLIASDEGLCWWCWGQGWSLVRSPRRLR